MDDIGSSICFDTIKIQKNGLYGYCDKEGKLIIDCIYESAIDFC